MIPAALIWIIFPGVVSILLYVFRRRERVVLGMGITISLLLTWFAWQWPIGENISLGLWPGMPSWEIDAQLIILGRSLIIDNATRPLIMFIYVGTAFWLGGAYTARLTQLFTPLGLGIAALLVATLAVRPTLYAALLIEAVALMCVPLLSPPGERLINGILRFLIFQTIGMCLILLGDWLIPTVEISSLDLTQSIQAAALIGLGFSLLEGVFPFHTWVTLLAENSHPFALSYVLFTLPMAIGLVSLIYLDTLTQLRIAPIVYNVLQIGGAFLIAFAGLWAALQNHLGRILGFAVIAQIGCAMLVFSLPSQSEYELLFLGIYFALLLPQGLSLAIWGLSLNIIRSRIGDLSFNSALGIGRKLPVATSGLLISNLSLAGLPLLASFPVSVILWSALSAQSLIAALIALLGSACLLIAGLRSMAVLTQIQGEVRPLWQVSESRYQATLLILGIFALIAVGLLPQLFLAPLVNMPFGYSSPGP